MPKKQAPVTTKHVATAQDLAAAPLAAAQQMVGMVDRMNAQTRQLAGSIGEAMLYHTSGQALLDETLAYMSRNQASVPLLQFDGSGFDGIQETLKIQQQENEVTRNEALAGFDSYMGEVKQLRGADVADAYSLPAATAIDPKSDDINASYWDEDSAEGDD